MNSEALKTVHLEWRGQLRSLFLIQMLFLSRPSSCGWNPIVRVTTPDASYSSQKAMCVCC